MCLLSYIVFSFSFFSVALGSNLLLAFCFKIIGVLWRIMVFGALWCFVFVSFWFSFYFTPVFSSKIEEILLEFEDDLGTIGPIQWPFKIFSADDSKIARGFCAFGLKFQFRFLGYTPSGYWFRFLFEITNHSNLNPLKGYYLIRCWSRWDRTSWNQVAPVRQEATQPLPEDQYAISYIEWR